MIVIIIATVIIVVNQKRNNMRCNQRYGPKEPDQIAPRVSPTIVWNHSQDPKDVIDPNN